MKTSRSRSLIRLLFILILIPILGVFYQAAASLIDAYRYPPPGVLVDVGGYHLHLNCQGAQTDGPTVIMEAGLGENSLTWTLVAPKLAEEMKVCVYDRAGLGWSETGEKTPSAIDRNGELHLLLQKAGVQPPFILVGHSLGAAYAFAYGQTYPDETAGLVLVDPGDNGTTGGFTTWAAEQPLTAVELQRFQAAYAKLISPAKKFDLLQLGEPLTVFGIPRIYFDLVYQMTPAFPPDMQSMVQDVDRALRSRSAYLHAALKEQEQSPSIYPVTYLPQAECGSKPVIVLSAKKEVQFPDPDTALVADLIQRWLAMRHQQLAGCSDRGQRVLVEGSGHYIQIDNPGAVISAVEQAVQSLTK